MKIVIDIPEEDYSVTLTKVMLACRGCEVTELTKGHGDLIDRNEVIKSLFDYHNGKKTIGQCIDDVSTIIEADTEEDE